MGSSLGSQWAYEATPLPILNYLTQTPDGQSVVFAGVATWAAIWGATGRRNSGQSEPQTHISKEGHPYLPICELCWCKGRSTFSDLLASIVICGAGACGWPSVAGGTERNEPSSPRHESWLVLLHRLWVSGEAYEPLRSSDQKAMPAVAKGKTFFGRKHKAQTPSSGDCIIAWPNFQSNRWNGRSTIRWQHRLKRERPTCTERNRKSRVRMEGWTAARRRKNHVQRKNKGTHLTPAGLLMESDYTSYAPATGPTKCSPAKTWQNCRISSQ